MTQLDTLPDELVLHCFKYLSARDLQTAGATSKRLRLRALDQQLWKDICIELTEGHTDDQEALPEEELTVSYYTLWNELLKEWGSRLGWWMADAGPNGAIYRLIFDRVSLSVHCQRLVNKGNSFDIFSAAEPNIPQHAVYDARGRRLVVFDEQHSLLNIMLFEPMLAFEICLSVAMKKQTRPDESNLEASSQLQSEAHGDALVRVRARSGFDSWHPLEVSRGRFLRDIRTSSQWHLPEPLFPPSTLIPILRDVEHVSSSSLTFRQTLSLHENGYHTNIYPMLSPEALPINHSPLCSMGNLEVLNGIYIAPYGLHGPEFLYIGVRTLTQEDFDEHNCWPWEGHFGRSKNHFGPFGDMPGSLWSDENHVSEIDVDAVRPGAIVIEGIKITGDRNVPRGTKTFIGFLTDPLASPPFLQAHIGDASVRHPARPWPLRTSLSLEDPLLLRYSELYSSSSVTGGITTPGKMRVAEDHFTRPTWIPCILRIESRCEIRLWCPLLSVVMVFKRV